MLKNRSAALLAPIVAGLLLGVTATNTTAKAPRKPEGTVVVAVQSMEGQIWLPYLGASASLQLLSGVYESLLEEGPNSTELRPMLAERWTVSPDGKTYDFFLRKGVQFHGGWGEFTADDVKFSIEQQVAEGSRAINAGKFRQLIDGVKVVDRYHVRILLKSANAEWLWLMSTWFQDSPITSKKYVEAVGNEKAGAHPVGTGPYRFVDQKIGDHLRLEALDSHWRLVPHFKSILIRVVPETRMALAMIQKGEADLTPLPLNMLKEAKAANVRMLRMPDSGQVAVHLGGMYLPEIAKTKYDPTSPWIPFSSEKAGKVRLALELAIDKETIRKRVLSGYAKPQNQVGFENDSTWSDPAWKPVPYDPQKAKALLAEAGYPKGFEKPITMWQIIMPGREQAMEVGEAVAQYWERNLGLKVARRVVDYGVVKAVWRERSDAWTSWAFQWQGPYPEPYMIAMRMGLTSSSFSVFGMDPRIDDIARKTMTEPDPKKRAALNRQFGQLWYEGRSTIPIGLIDTLFAASEKVGNWDRKPGIGLVQNLEYLRP
ncbi:MAG: ABC transporter substrate-binding protein [Chloroflexi bacterium]|nr:ABC transporter substrate-binding protein [Chloroflexota bacterium]